MSDLAKLRAVITFCSFSVFTGACPLSIRPILFQMDHVSQSFPSPGTPSVPACVPADSTSSGRDLQTGAKAGLEVSAESPTDIDDVDLDVTISKLPKKLVFFP